MIILVDADSLIFASCFRKKEFIDDEKFNSIEETIFKFDESFAKVINEIEDRYDIDKVITFAGARGNFRKHISKTYKANRKKIDIPPTLSEIQNYVIEKYSAIVGYGVETDDVVATYWKNLTDTFGRDEVLIVSIDKDYKQFPALIYNYHYKSKCFYDLSKAEALYNFYEQMIIGDTADNVNFCKGYGSSYCKKAFKDCLSEYSYIKVVFNLFKKIYKSKARERFIECNLLLKLRTK